MRSATSRPKLPFDHIGKTRPFSLWPSDGNDSYCGRIATTPYRSIKPLLAEAQRGSVIGDDVFYVFGETRFRKCLNLKSNPHGRFVPHCAGRGAWMNCHGSCALTTEAGASVSVPRCSSFSRCLRVTAGIATRADWGPLPEAKQTRPVYPPECQPTLRSKLQWPFVGRNRACIRNISMEPVYMRNVRQKGIIERQTLWQAGYKKLWHAKPMLLMVKSGRVSVRFQL